jgi:thiol-disulfide isomerase/thioredoxin
VRHRTSYFASVAALLACVVILAGCAAAAQTLPPAGVSPTIAYASIGFIPTVNPVPTMPSWFGTELTDVNTGKTFRVSDFSGKVILVDTMATWCPTFQGEMSQVQQLPAMLGASSSELVRISLDVDPNEDATILKKYAATNKFDWYIAVAPESVGQFLAGNYDIQYINPPLQPMLFIDKKGGVYGLPFGIKSAKSIMLTLSPYLAP